MRKIGIAVGGGKAFILSMTTVFTLIGLSIIGLKTIIK
jgi:hypothetical protein